MIWLILLIGFILRLISLNQSLWLDEAISVLAVRGHDLVYIWSHFFTVDVHPPGFYILLWLTGNLFGWSEIAIRLPSVILGIGTIYLTYKIGQLIFSKSVGLSAALLLAINPLHLYYSQEARMYSLAAFGVTLSFYYFSKALKDQKINWLGYGLSLIIILWSDYLPSIVILIQVGYLMLDKKWLKDKRFKYGLLIGLVSFIPLIGLAWQQFRGGLAVASSLPSWGKVVGGSSFKDLTLLPLKTETGRISITGNAFFKVLTGLVSLTYLYLLVSLFKKTSRPVVVLILWLVLPPVLTFIATFFVPLFSYYRFIFILPAFCLLVAEGLISQKLIPQKLLLIWLVALELSFCLIYLTNPNFHREDWRAAVQFTDKLNMSDHVVLFEDDNLPAPFLYYSQNLNQAVPGLDKVPPTTSNIVLLANRVKDKDQIYVYNYLVDITDPNRLLGQELVTLGYKQTNTYNFNGVGFIYLYSKVK